MALTSQGCCVNKGVYTDTQPGCKNPARPFRAPYLRYTIILNSAMNFYLISNMCASVHADFCRP